MASIAERRRQFRALHETGCFVIPNPWDEGSARYLATLGFKALATTSAGFAYASGRPDGDVPRAAELAYIARMVEATDLPVNADFEAGYADDPDGVAESVRLCIATGVAGLSIEDATGDRGCPLYDHDTSLARLRAARAAIDRSGVPVLLTARCEAWLVGDPDAERVALDRSVAFADAGADCIFVPKLPVDRIAELVRAVAPTPVNVLVNAPDPALTLARLGDLGVRRISVGSALARVAWAAALRAARAIADTRAFDGLAEAAPFAVLDDMFRSPKR